MGSKPPIDENSLGHLFFRLIDDAEHFVRAEVRLYRAQIVARLSEAKVAIALAIAAFLIAQSSIIALLIGLVLVVRREVHSAGLATFIVVGGALMLALILFGIAFAKIKKMTRVGNDAP